MLNGILSALTWPGRKLISLERQGRMVWSLVAVDAAGLGLWLFALNGYFFHRPLDRDDWSTIIGVPLLCYAACLQYRLRPGRPRWHWLIKAVLGEALAAGILHSIFVRLGMDLSGRQVLKFFASHLLLLGLTRLAYLVCRRTLPRAPLECVRLMLVAGAGVFFLAGRFVTSAGVGSGDSYWYCIMLADFVKQWRAGFFPVFVGQSEYAFNGAIIPLRFAPGLQHWAGMVDWFTGQSLPFYTLQNLSLALIALAGGFSAYFCAAAILPRWRWTALALAALYVSCPGVLSLGYQGDLFMSMMTLPFVPLTLYGIWRTLQADDRTAIAWTVLPLAAAWYCHPPIALWLTLITVLAHAAIGWRRWRDPRLYAWWGRGLALFLLAAGYLFVSVLTLRLPPTASNVDVILQSIGGAFPGMLLPVSENANLLSDYQLGWTLGSLLLLALCGAIFRPRRADFVLLLAAGGMLVLLLPIPGLNSALWRGMPPAIRNITYHWPMQRFYVILAGLVVILAAAAWAKWAPTRWMGKAAALVLLSVGLFWSCREGIKFALHDYLVRGPAPLPVPEPLLERNNIVLTRYAFGSFPFVPPYFSHGYIDPYLENRVLAPDQKSVLASNAAAAEPSAAATEIPLTAVYDGIQVAVLSPGFAIAPGVRYAARFAPLTPLAPGSLLVAGKIALRQYYMPDSAMGMLHQVPGNAFGLNANSRDFFPLWTSQSQPETIGIHYVYDQPPPAPVPVHFARLYLQAYALDRLPVKVSSWMPYRANTTAAATGDWLETPRMYLPGYAATVNGRTADVSASPGGLVAVRLQAGENDVVLRYPGPWLLRVAYGLALLTWLGVIGVLIRNAVRAWPRPAAA